MAIVLITAVKNIDFEKLHHHLAIYTQVICLSVSGRESKS